MLLLELKGITKLFDQENGIANIDLQVQQGEFVTLLGPSGCGKTTMLNVIGGFLKPDEGSVLLDGEDITSAPPEQRPLSTVFQSYALFPHMSVLENAAYGLRYMRRMSKKQAQQEACAYLEIVGLSGYEYTRIGKLSGGQQQRVALARAMATKPRLLLLDEPLSNLDAALRVKMRTELKALQRQLGITMVLVTHDQDEALSMSDRIVVMNRGRILQIGTPYDIYFAPENSIVSDFVGRANHVHCGGEELLIRPEDIEMMPDASGSFRINEKLFMGAKTQYHLESEEEQIEVELTGIAGTRFAIGDRVSISFESKRV